MFRQRVNGPILQATEADARARRYVNEAAIDERETNYKQKSNTARS